MICFISANGIYSLYTYNYVGFFSLCIKVNFNNDYIVLNIFYDKIYLQRIFSKLNIWLSRYYTMHYRRWNYRKNTFLMQIKSYFLFLTVFVHTVLSMRTHIWELLKMYLCFCQPSNMDTHYIHAYKINFKNLSINWISKK